MQNHISLVTLGVKNIKTSRRFYEEGFGWNPVFENDVIVFFQMNGFVFSIFQEDALAEDANRKTFNKPGAVALAHNVASRDDVIPVMEQLIRAGGKLLRKADEPPHGGFRGYVTDPDDHAWEIAHNPAWPIDSDGHVTFGT